jgi:hypothetical protein
MEHLENMGLDVLRPLRVDLREHVLAVIQRPHLAHGFVADPGDDATDLVHHRVGGAALGPPVVLGMGQGIADGVDLAVLPLDGHHRRGRRVVLHVVNARPDIDDRLEAGMGGDILHAFTIDEHFAAVAERVAVLGAGADHRLPLVVVVSCMRAKLWVLARWVR